MGNISTAVILAAGLGSRIRSFTKDLPKGFIPIDNKPIIKQSIEKLIGAGVEKIIIGTGYKSEAYEALMDEYPQIQCKRNSLFATTGSMFTLNNLKDLIEEDFLLLESDLIFDKNGLEILKDDPSETVILASGRTSSNDEVYIEVNSENRLIKMSKIESELSSVYGELTGISKISLNTFNEMNVFAEKQFVENSMLDYEYTMVATSTVKPIFVNKIEDFIWCEIDDEDHLERALTIIYPRIKASENPVS